MRNGEERDDQLGRVAEGRVQQSADPGAGVVCRMLGRFADQPGERNERGGRDHEENDVVDTREIEREDDRREDEREREETTCHGRSDPR